MASMAAAHTASQTAEEREGKGGDAEQPHGIPGEEQGRDSGGRDGGADGHRRWAVPQGVGPGVGDRGVRGAAGAFPRGEVGAGRGIDCSTPEGLFQGIRDRQGPKGPEGIMEGCEGWEGSGVRAREGTKSLLDKGEVHLAAV